jgi:hypothetical protein
MGLKDLWLWRAPAPRGTGAEYLFWYFDGADQLLHTTSARCESDAAAICAAGKKMTDSDATLEIYQTKGARIVYRGNPLEKDRAAASSAILADADGVR